jgi:hypothetical protein
MRLVSFSEVYETLRLPNRAITKQTWARYAVMWLWGALLPFGMSWAFSQRRWLGFALGAAGSLALYCTGGLKSTLAGLVLVPVAYCLVRSQSATFGARCAWIAAGVLAVLNMANVAADNRVGPLLVLSAIVLARTFAGPGLSTAQYHDFFADHPVTYYSHVSGINFFVSYPYSENLGFEIGHFYTGSLDLNANAHFWCTDGLAALGLPGLILASLLCAAVFWLLDNAAAGKPVEITAPAAASATIIVANTSIFTTLLSGGLFLLGFLFYLSPTGTSRGPRTLRIQAQDS